jgi:hypothetical protein
VSLEDVQDFASALEDRPINIKDRNLSGLSQLSEEFGFQVLSKKLSAHRRLPGLSSTQTAECQSRISALEEPIGQHERQITTLQSGLSSRLRGFETDLVRLSSELDAFRDTKKSYTALGRIREACAALSRLSRTTCFYRSVNSCCTASARTCEASARRTAGSCRTARMDGFADRLSLSAAV